MGRISSLSIAAAVLTGGKSSRLGRDKSLLRFKGRTLTALMAEKLLKAGYAPVFIVGPRKRYGFGGDLKVIGERFRGSGPLSGIESALRHCQAPCLVIPCDLPYMSVKALKLLRRASDGKAAAVPENPLPAIFIPQMLPEIQRRLFQKKLAVYPLMKNAKNIKGIAKRNFFNLNDREALKIVRSDKRVA